MSGLLFFVSLSVNHSTPPMNPPPLEILYEDNHLLAVVKPAGLATMGTPGDRPTLLSLAKEYVKDRYHKPGNVYLGVMSRLDAPVTGIVLLARTSKAADRMTDQFRSHAVEKNYWAIVEGLVEPAAGRLVDWLGQDERHRRMHIVGPTLSGAKEARLSYRRLPRSQRPLVAGGPIGNGPQAPDPSAVVPSRPSDRRRPEVRQRRALPGRHRPARPSAGNCASHHRHAIGVRGPAA